MNIFSIHNASRMRVIKTCRAYLIRLCGFRSRVTCLRQVERLPLPSHLLTTASGTNIQSLASPMALTLSPSTSSLLGHLSVWVRRCTLVFVSGTSVPYNSHAQIPQWETHALVFRRLSFADMRGVAEQFVGRQLVDLRR